MKILTLMMLFASSAMAEQPREPKDMRCVAIEVAARHVMHYWQSGVSASEMMYHVDIYKTAEERQMYIMLAEEAMAYSSQYNTTAYKEDTIKSFVDYAFMRCYRGEL